MKTKEARIETGDWITYRHSPGEKGPLFLIHGNMCDSAVWEPIFAQLPDYEIYAPDLPGAGGSYFLKWGFVKVKNYVDYMHMFLRKVASPLDSITVCGLSAGAPIAVQIANRLPNYKLRGTALIAPPAPDGYHAPFYRLPELWTRTLLALTSGSLRYQRNTRSLSRVVRNLSMEQDLKELSGRVLVARGERDRVVSESMARETFNAISAENKRYRELKGAGHIPQRSKPATVSALIANTGFLP